MTLSKAELLSQCLQLDFVLFSHIIDLLHTFISHSVNLLTKYLAERICLYVRKGVSLSFFVYRIKVCHVLESLQTSVMFRIFSRIDESSWHRIGCLVIIVVSFVNSCNLMVLVIDDDIGYRLVFVFCRFMLEVLLIVTSLDKI